MDIGEEIDKYDVVDNFVAAADNELDTPRIRRIRRDFLKACGLREK